MHLTCRLFFRDPWNIVIAGSTFQSLVSQTWVWLPSFPLTALQGPLLPSVRAKFLIWALGAPASDASPALLLAMPSGILNSGHREQPAVPPLQLLWFLLGSSTQFLFPLPHLLGPASSLSSPVQPCCHLHAPYFHLSLLAICMTSLVNCLFSAFADFPTDCLFFFNQSFKNIYARWWKFFKVPSPLNNSNNKERKFTW